MNFSAFQQDQIQKPGLIDFTEIDFPGVVSEEVENVLLADAVDVLAIPVMPACALKAVLLPAVLDPPSNLVVIFTQAQLQIPHRVAVSDSPRGPHVLALVDHRADRAVQSLCNRYCRHAARHVVQNIQLVPRPELSIHVHRQAQARSLALDVPARQAGQANHPVENTGDSTHRNTAP